MQAVVAEQLSKIIECCATAAGPAAAVVDTTDDEHTTKAEKRRRLVEETQTGKAAISVHVQTPGGSTVVIHAAWPIRVQKLKEAIQQKEGIAWHQQSLFLLEKNKSSQSSGNKSGVLPLQDRAVVGKSCSLAMFVKVPFRWDGASPLVSSCVPAQVVLNDTKEIASKSKMADVGFENCLVATPAMRGAGELHTLSVRLMLNPTYHRPSSSASVLMGIVRDGAAHDEDHSERDVDNGIAFKHNGFLIDAADGGLCGNGRCNADPAGRFGAGSMLTMRLDLHVGTLKFWVDGKRHGPGYRDIDCSGTYRWATSLFFMCDCVQICSTPPWPSFLD